MAASSTSWPFQTTCDSTVTVRFSSKNNDEASASLPRFGIGYWSIRGLAAPIRMMLCAAQQDHTVYLYDCLENNSTTTCNTDSSSNEDDWIQGYHTEKPRLRDAYQNSFMNLPYFVDQKEQLLLTQTNACLQYAGECCNMMGGSTGAVERAQAMQLLCELYDLRNVMVGYAYAEPNENDAKKQQAAACVEAAQAHLAKFEHHLANKTKTAGGTIHFLVGDTFSAPDFHLFEMVDQFDGLCKSKGLPDCLEEYPHVRAFQTGFAKLP